MRRCCGKPSGEKKGQLERSAKLFAMAAMHTEAAQALAERAELSPKNPMIWNDLGVEYMAAGEPQAARDAFLKASEAFSEYPLPLYNLGHSSMMRCDDEKAKGSLELVRKLATEAINYLSESVALEPLLCPAHALLAKAYELVGEREMARVHLDEAVKLNPSLAADPKPTWLQRILLSRAEDERSVESQSRFLLSSGSMWP